MAFSLAGTSLGQLLLQPPNVKGWPGGHNWISTGTFQPRETYSDIFLINPPALDGGTKVSGIKIEFVSPSAWVEALPNYGTMTSHEMAAALTALVLNKTLGPNETGTLYTSFNPGNLPENDYTPDDKTVAGFAIALANLPEFQLV